MSSVPPNDNKAGNPDDRKRKNDDVDTPDGHKKHQVIPTDDSPFGKVGEFKLVDSDDESEASEDDGDKARFIIIKPEGNNVMHGFVMYLEGYGDKYLGNIMFGKGKNDNNFKKATKVVRRVIHPLGEDGQELKNPREFPYRGVIVLAKPGTTVSPQDCVSWYNNMFIGPFKALTGGQLAGDKYPVPEVTTNIRTNWTSTVPIEHMDQVLRHYAMIINEDKKVGAKDRSPMLNVTTYIKKGSSQLYSIFPEGGLTRKLVRTYNIAQKHMTKLDIDILAAAKKAKGTETENNSDNKDNGDSNGQDV